MDKTNGTSIIMLTHNNLSMTQLCINSILQFTDVPYEIIVVDNNSTDGTVPWLKSLNHIKLILNDKDEGVPKGRNQGIEAADKNNDILLLNSDVCVTKNWLRNMQLALYSETTVGAVSCVSNISSYLQAIATNYTTLEEMHAFAEKINISNLNSWDERIMLLGFCMLIKRSTLDKVGLFDEIFTPGGFEDDDYSYRVRLEGYKLLLCRDTFVHQDASSTFKTVYTPEESIVIWHANKQKFIEKWGFDSNYSRLIRFEMLELLEMANVKPSRVLEVGCGCGATLLEIKSQYKGVSLHGVELSQMPAKIASGFAEIHTQDVETMDFGYPDDYFDCIIFGDVLEHLRDPWGLLQRIKKHLSPDGVVLASLPNIMHYSILHNLINGKWDYTDAGILDRTHLRFFTLDSIISMFHNAGYEFLKISTTTSDNPAEHSQVEAFIKYLTQIALSDKSNQYKAFQYILSAKKR